MAQNSFVALDSQSPHLLCGGQMLRVPTKHTELLSLPKALKGPFLLGREIARSLGVPVEVPGKHGVDAPLSWPHTAVVEASQP